MNLAKPLALFDYDGVIVDSEPVYLRIWSELLSEEGAALCAQFHRGRHESEVYNVVRQHLKEPGLTLDEVSAQRKKRFNELVRRKELSTVNGIENLLRSWHCIRRMFVVSNSDRNSVEVGLKSCGLIEYFEGIICVGTGIARKPDPSLYLLALRQAAADASGAFAIEDTWLGAQAALAAGIDVILVGGESSISLPLGQCKITIVDTLDEILMLSL